MSKHVFGAPHRDYVRNKKTVDAIFNKFENKHRRDLAKWEAQFNIPYATMNGWWNQYRKNKEWRPYNTSCHGLHHRIFTENEEKAISEFIQMEYIDPGFIFTNQEFRRVAMHS